MKPRDGRRDDAQFDLFNHLRKWTYSAHQSFEGDEQSWLDEVTEVAEEFHDKLPSCRLDPMPTQLIHDLAADCAVWTWETLHTGVVTSAEN